MIARDRKIFVALAAMASPGSGLSTVEHAGPQAAGVYFLK
jgi:hypothetical protein